MLTNPPFSIPFTPSTTCGRSMCDPQMRSSLIDCVRS
jgi:hypothetical protein